MTNKFVFIKAFTCRIWPILHGATIKDKINMLSYAMLITIFPKLLLDTSPLPRKLKSRIEALKVCLCRNSIVCFKINADRVCFKPVDNESLWILSHVFEPYTLRYILKYLSKGDVFIDVGAHIGKYTVIAAKLVGNNGSVIAIEPHPYNFKTLLYNIRLNKLNNVIPLNIAAWDSETMADLYIGKSSGGHSFKTLSGSKIRVYARPLDNVIDELKLSKVDLIKVDVEGAEAEVLRGLKRTIHRFKPIILIEIWNMDIAVSYTHLTLPTN